MLLGLHVRVELVLPVEALVARTADERSDAAVHHLVPGQVGSVREFLVARLAGVRFLAGVLPQVLVQVAPVLERLITVGAVHLRLFGLLLVVTGRGLGVRSVPGFGGGFILKKLKSEFVYIFFYFIISRNAL